MHAGLQVITSCKIVLAAKSLHEDKDVQSLCSLRVLGPVSFVSSIAGEGKVAVEACAQERVQNCAIFNTRAHWQFSVCRACTLGFTGQSLGGPLSLVGANAKLFISSAAGNLPRSAKSIIFGIRKICM